MISIYVDPKGWNTEIWPSFMATYYPKHRVVLARTLKKDWGMTVASSWRGFRPYRIDFESEKRYNFFCLAYSNLLEKHKVRIPSRLEEARERYKRNNE